MATRSSRKHLRKIWRNWIKPLAIMLLVLGTIRSAVADWNDVPTGSMMPSILEGDRIFVNKLAYDLKLPFTMRRLASWSQPERGDVIVFYSPEDGQRMVKRVIGLPGDKIALRDNHLLVNEKLADYAPLDRQIIEQIDAGERGQFLFAAEHLQGRDHPVMSMPGKRAMRTFGPTTVLEDHYFVMGDNRDNSRDSRYFGFVPRQLIAGKATAVVLSVDATRHYLPRWGRFFTSMP